MADCRSYPQNYCYPLYFFKLDQLFKIRLKFGKFMEITFQQFIWRERVFFLRSQTGVNTVEEIKLYAGFSLLRQFIHANKGAFILLAVDLRAYKKIETM